MSIYRTAKLINVCGLYICRYIISVQTKLIITCAMFYEKGAQRELVRYHYHHEVEEALVCFLREGNMSTVLPACI